MVCASLKRINNRHDHFGGQIRIFPVRLFSASPARIARKIHVRSENMVTTADPGLTGADLEHSSDEIGVPTGRQRKRDRKYRRSLAHVSVQDLVVENCGNPKPGIFL